MYIIPLKILRCDFFFEPKIVVVEVSVFVNAKKLYTVDATLKRREKISLRGGNSLVVWGDKG